MTTAHVKQAAIGLLIVVLAFFVACYVCQYYVPGTMDKYLTEFGELIVGATIAVVLVIVFLLFGFSPRAFVLTGVFTALFVVLVLALSCGGINLGLFKESVYVWEHTALPVFAASPIYWLLTLLIKVLKRARTS